MKTKLSGCGNTFILIDEYEKQIVENKRDFVVKVAKDENVDGVLFLNKPLNDADLEMRIFDKDGTEAQMCGNGIRCFVRYAYDKGYIGRKAKILTGDNIKETEVTGELISVDMGTPREFQKLNDYQYFVFTGVPHFVWFKDNLTLKEARASGACIRYNRNLCSILEHEEGINVNFVKVNSRKEIEILTYEVGVEDVTKACGTGSTAAAFVSHVVKNCRFPIKVRNTGGDIIIDFKKGRLTMTGNAEYL